MAKQPKSKSRKIQLVIVGLEDQPILEALVAQYGTYKNVVSQALRLLNANRGGK
jgi:hypothetical protein